MCIFIGSEWKRPFSPSKCLSKKEVSEVKKGQTQQRRIKKFKRKRKSSLPASDPISVLHQGGASARQPN